MKKSKNKKTGGKFKISFQSPGRNFVRNVFALNRYAAKEKAFRLENLNWGSTYDRFTTVYKY